MLPRMGDVVCHIVDRATWARAVEAGRYAPPSLAREGFIHLSAPEQVARTAARFFAGVDDLVVLVIAIGDLRAVLRWEAADGELFPHPYGPIDPSTVRELRELASFTP
ncbi:MAG: DUF952 domain-containing protein [Deltaproteobacteria bacterium]|nr:DUF952 domain-containing protein [Deltaproteobacteria bacterium]